MAFPTGYSKYQTITIDYTKVPGDLTDYIVHVNLADLVKAGADIFDTCRTDGGDIRATKTDGTTELAVQVVAIDTIAKTGELQIKFSGTLSSSTNTVIRIYYNGTDTMPAVTDTYGRNAVWSNHRARYSLADVNDSTSNGYNLTNTGSVAFNSAKIGNGADLGASNSTKYLRIANDVGITGGAITLSAWVKMSTEIGAGLYPLLNQGSTTNHVNYFLMYEYNSGTRRLSINRQKQAVANQLAYHNVTLGTTDWNLIALTYDGSTLRCHLNGTQVATLAASGNGTSAAVSQTRIGYEDGQYTSVYYASAIFDEARVLSSAMSANWLTTQYNNQNSPSTFYSSGAEVSTATIVSPAAQVATFSLPTRTIIRGAIVSVATQVNTFSLPVRTVTAAVRLSVTAQVATFTIPPYGISASAVVFGATTQVLTFSIPTYQVLRGAIISPDGQTLTFTVPSPVIATGNTVSVEPVVLTFTIPALAFIGALWRRSARGSADWTRSSINND